MLCICSALTLPVVGWSDDPAEDKLDQNLSSFPVNPAADTERKTGNSRPLDRESRIRRLRAEERARTLRRIRTLMDNGAVGLAARLINDRQPDPDDIAPWIEWERARMESYLELGDYRDVLARLSVLPDAVDADVRRDFIRYAALAELALDEPALARRRARQLLWSKELVAEEDVKTWRRIIVRSYIAESRYSDARVAMQKFEAEYLPTDQDFSVLKARISLLAGDYGFVIDTLNNRDDIEAQLLLTLAHLNAGSYTSGEAIKRVRALREKIEGDPRLRALSFSVEAEAAIAASDLSNMVQAIEQRSIIAAPKDDPLSGFHISELWQAWQAYAVAVADKLDFIQSDDASWVESAEKLLATDIYASRSLFAWVLLNGTNKDWIAQANAGLARGLLASDETTDLALLIFSEPSIDQGAEQKFVDTPDLPVNERIRLSDAALRAGKMDIAEFLVRGIEEAPGKISEREWVIRRARIAIYAGAYEDGARILQTFVDGINTLEGEFIDRLLQPVFDLQSLEEHALALPVLRRILTLALEKRYQWELPFWMAQSASALTYHAEAAELYLDSARLVDDTKSGQLWRLSALSKAAEEMAASGLPGDARRLYESVMVSLDDPLRRADVERRLQQLFLVEAKQLRRLRQDGTKVSR